MELTFIDAIKHLRYPFTLVHTESKARSYSHDCRVYAIAPALLLGTFFAYNVNVRFGLGVGLSVFYGLAWRFKKQRMIAENSRYSPYTETHDPAKWKTTIADCVVKFASLPLNFNITPSEMMGNLYAATVRAGYNGYLVDHTVFKVDPENINRMQDKTIYDRNVSVITAPPFKLTTLFQIQDGDGLKMTKQLAEENLKPVYLTMVDLHSAPFQTKMPPLDVYVEKCPRYPPNYRPAPQRIYNQEIRANLWIRSLFHKVADASQNIKLRRIWGCFQYSFDKMGVDHTLYTPKLPVIRHEKGLEYAFCEPYFIDVVASSTSKFDKTGIAPDEREFKKRLSAMLRTSFHTGHDAIVLEDEALIAKVEIAPLVKEVMGYIEFNNRFKKVCIVTNSNLPNRLGVYEKTFNVKTSLLSRFFNLLK